MEAPKPKLSPLRPQEILQSWKDIASYLNRSERTVQRWEKEEELPVHRLVHSSGGSIYAYPDELDNWLSQRMKKKPEAVAPVSAAPVSATPNNFGLRLAATAALTMAVGLVAWYFLSSNSQGIITATPATFFPGLEYGAVFSPDSKKLAFVWEGTDGNEDIYTMNIGDHKPTRITTNAASDFSPAWSPDGKNIAFLRDEADDHFSLNMLDLASRTEHRLALLSGRRIQRELITRMQYLDWSPDGKWLIASVMPTASELQSLFLISPITGTQRRLTFPPSGQADLTPTFDHAGKQIAFVRTEAGTPAAKLLIVPVDGERIGEAHAVDIPGFENHSIYAPRWSPKADQIAFIANPLGPFQLFRFKLNSKDRPQPIAGLLEQPDHCSLAISPSGRLAYSSISLDTNVWKLDLRNPAKAKALTETTRREYSPQYSPSGDRIAFMSDRTSRLQIWTANPDGTDPRQITFMEGTYTTSPSWSPDSQTILFDSKPGESSDIYAIPREGGTPVQLTREPSIDANPVFTPDAKSILFSSNRSGQMEVWKMSAKGENSTKFTSAGGKFPMISNGRVYFRKEDTSVWSMPVSGGAEKLEIEKAFGFAPAAKGIYFFTAATRGKLLFLNTATHARQEVATFTKQLFPVLGLSPDQASVLFSQADNRNHDVVVVDNIW